MGSNSGTLIFRRLIGLCWLTRRRKVEDATCLSFLSPMATANAISGSKDLFIFKFGSCLSFGNSWYFFWSVGSILQANGFSIDDVGGVV